MSSRLRVHNLVKLDSVYFVWNLWCFSIWWIKKDLVSIDLLGFLVQHKLYKSSTRFESTTLLIDISKDSAADHLIWGTCTGTRFIRRGHIFWMQRVPVGTCVYLCTSYNIFMCRSLKQDSLFGDDRWIWRTVMKEPSMLIYARASVGIFSCKFILKNWFSHWHLCLINYFIGLIWHYT